MCAYEKKKLTVTGPVDDSSLVAPRWHPPELRGGVRWLDMSSRRRQRCRRPTQLEKFATDAIVILIAGAGRNGGRGKKWTRHLDQTKESQMLRTTFVQ